LLGVKGIPAFTKNINFLVGGPRLFPAVGAEDMLGGLFIILLVSMAATFFPARAATRVQPVEAMRDAE
jgi:ABC-type lipoprotein release transport system permease subunit